MALRYASVLALTILLSGCADVRTAMLFGRIAPAPEGRFMPAQDGSYHSELIGVMAPESRFARLRIGMTVREVVDMLGEPDNMHRYETGKRWLPFYYGADVQRVQYRYKGEGCLTFTGGNQWASGRQQLIRMEIDQEGKCLSHPDRESAQSLPNSSPNS